MCPVIVFASTISFQKFVEYSLLLIIVQPLTSLCPESSYVYTILVILMECSSTFLFFLYINIYECTNVYLRENLLLLEFLLPCQCQQHWLISLYTTKNFSYMGILYEGSVGECCWGLYLNLRG